MEMKNKMLPVTVLSGFLGSGKTTLLQRILQEKHNMKIAVIVNDMAEINIDANLIKGTVVQAEQSLIEMSNGCICCTLREDLLVEINKLAQQNKFDYLVIESSGISEPLPVAETFTFEAEDGKKLGDYAQLDTMVTVVDASTFFENFSSRKTLKENDEHVDEDDERSIVDLLTDQVEFANVIIINKIDLVKEEEVQKIITHIKALNPDAQIETTTHCNIALEKIINTKLFDFEKAANAPLWLKEARGTHVPETEEYGIGSFVYKAQKPFHPGKFWDFMHNLPKNIIRAKGTFWISTQPKVAILFSLVGTKKTAYPVGIWQSETEEQTSDEEQHPIYKDKKQELVFIGIDIDKQAIISALDACLSDNDNVPKKDPFPYWQEEMMQALLDTQK